MRWRQTVINTIVSHIISLIPLTSGVTKKGVRIESLQLTNFNRPNESAAKNEAPQYYSEIMNQ